MMYSGILPVLTSSQQVALCGIGQEVIAFEMAYANSTNSSIEVILSIYRQTLAAAETIQLTVPAKSRISAPKIALQPGDHVDTQAGATGVSLLWSLDVDTGVNPVATGFTLRGDWSNITAYSACDLVLRNGSLYGAIQAGTNKDPLTQTAYWMLMLDGSGTMTAITTIVAGAPVDMDTLEKISASLGDDPDFAGTMAAALALKANSASLAPVALSGLMSDTSDFNKLAIRRAFFSREL